MEIAVNDIPITGKHYEIDIDVVDLDVEFLAPAHFAGNIYKSGEDVRVEGQISACLQVICHRCLERFTLNITSPVQLFYLPQKTEYEIAEPSVAELGLLHYQDNVIDLAEAARDTIIIEMPMKLLCQEGCRGLCVKCGQNLNETQCDCVREVVAANPFQEFFQKYNKNQ